MIVPEMRHTSLQERGTIGQMRHGLGEGKTGRYTQNLTLKVFEMNYNFKPPLCVDNNHEVKSRPLFEERQFII